MSLSILEAWIVPCQTSHITIHSSWKFVLLQLRILVHFYTETYILPFGSVALYFVMPASLRRIQNLGILEPSAAFIKKQYQAKTHVANNKHAQNYGITIEGSTGLK
jgi:hypothetical protein